LANHGAKKREKRTKGGVNGERYQGGGKNALVQTARGKRTVKKNATRKGEGVRARQNERVKKQTSRA